MGNSETVVQLANGWSLRSGLYDNYSDFTCGDYVRLCDERGTEILYWDSDEWKRDPVLVMGAIMNAAANKGIPLSCDCMDCAVCKGKRTICAKCMMCARCHEHKPGCMGCNLHG
jgi:hypothetical protein